LLGLIPLLLGVSIIIFSILQSIPGGPLAVYLDNPHLGPDDIEILKHQLGLDQPVPVQYVRWLKGFVVGDWGFSFSTGRPVTQIVSERYPQTAKLMGSTFLFAALVSIPIGIFSATRKYSAFDYVTTVGTFFGLSMPVFWFGLMLQLLLAVKLRWLPVAGVANVGNDSGMLANLRYLIMPTIVLSLIHIGRWTRYVRSGMLEVLSQDYIRTARSKGLAEQRVIYRHALKNALIPVVTVMAIDLGLMVSGAVVTESIFAWPGVGSLLIDSVRKVDYPVLMALIMASSFAVIFMNFVADFAYGFLNPQVRYD
jgi:peptide/nickel transport system permease protein